MEIERKFLLLNDDWKVRAMPGILYRQGYLTTEKNRTVRIRTAGEIGFITIKGETINISRQEYEYEIPLSQANEMLNTLCLRPIIEKTRYMHGAWEIDVFHGDNDGLVVAEIELDSESQKFLHPDWLGQEVSNDARYYNSNLILNPFSLWSDVNHTKLTK